MSALLEIRALNDVGLAAFVDFVRKTRAEENLSGLLLPPPKYLLSDANFLSSKQYGSAVDSTKLFADRLELGQYLITQAGEKFSDEQYSDYGMWAWLALVYFDQLRNKKIVTRKGLATATQREEHFVPHEWIVKAGRNLGYRHAVRTPFRVVKVFGPNARFFLSDTGMSVMGEAIEQLLSDPKILSSSKLLELIFDLYRNKDGVPRKGTFAYPPKASKAGKKLGRGYGGLRRLTDILLPRVKLTCDVDVMTLSQIKSVCGAEFAAN
jgi:hypothetical protein